MIGLPQLPSSWVWLPLGQVLERRENRIDPLTSPEVDFNYIGLEDIESGTGQLRNGGPKPTKGREIASLKNVFFKSDLLYGKLRPALNKVYLAESDGICSTDIWVFRTKSLAIPEYVAYYWEH